MADRLMGVETEYALAAFDAAGNRVRPGVVLEALMDQAGATLCHLHSGNKNNLFLENGSRLYIDCGGHPELSTPETTNPWDTVRYVLAGDRIIRNLAAAVQQKLRGAASVEVFKCNVGYSCNGLATTWGCHESYLHQADPKILADQLIPHFVSRIIYTGAGGFDNTSPGLEFLLSPRVPHLCEEISGGSMSGRAIFHTKCEPLCAEADKTYDRCHILCAESVCSEKAMWLKVGTTPLLLALVEAGHTPGKEVALASPLDAMRRFATDPHCTAVVRTRDGRHVSALAVQRHYLACVEAYLDAPFMPPWAEDVCAVWRATLDCLEQGAPTSAATTLDWAMKWLLYQDLAKRHGVAWEALPRWTFVVRQLTNALAGTPEFRDKTVPVEAILAPKGPIADVTQALTPFLESHGLAWDGLRTFLTLRHKLFETDMRFSQLGEKSIFAAMDQAGLLDHHVPGVDNIAHAFTNPPAQGRARLRGEWIRRLAGKNGCTANWYAIWDPEANRWLDLNRPLSTEEVWRTLDTPPPGTPSPDMSDMMARLMHHRRLMRAELGAQRRSG